ncbi:MAG: hypothetical protein ABL957_17105 [Parvularculaceae bacterium]
MTSHLLQRLLRGLHYIEGGGSWRLKPHEAILLNAVLDRLATDAKTRVQEQMAHGYFVERMSDGRINVIRLHKKPGDLAIQDSSFADALYNVRLSVEARRENAHVTFLKGFIFSIETKHGKHFYVGKTISVLDASVGDPHQSFTRAIDRLEHGKDGHLATGE